MRTSSAYGERFGQSLRVAQAPTLLSRTLRRTELAVTEVRADNPAEEMSGRLPREDAFIVSLQLRDYPRHEYWEDGRKAPVSSLAAGSTGLHDLRRDPVFLINNPFHSVHVFVPRKTLDAVADEAAAPRIGELRFQSGATVDDPLARNLIQSLRPALRQPEEANRLFVSAVLLAIAAHTAVTYGGMKTRAPPPRGGLAPWQERRATEMLTANLDGEVSLRDLAGSCGLSPSHFAHAFRRSFGVAPHQWLVECRIDTAKGLLRNSSLPLAEVASACGFADQSHFTRVFAARVGTAPGAWRKALRD